MAHDIIEITRLQNTSAIDDFLEAVVNSDMFCRSSGLRTIGIDSIDELNQAIEKAMTICTTYGIAVPDHFKKIYISDEHGERIEEDWMLSRFAYMLVTINCSPLNPGVAGLQIELIRKFLAK